MKTPNVSADTIVFTKMHGLGNDFVIINTMTQSVAELEQKTIKEIADRHQGIGFDQLLLIGESREADFHCRIFNADGREAEQCGNGLRCVARLLHEENLCGRELTIATKAGVFPVNIKDYDHISIIMGIPVIEEKLFKLKENLAISLVSMGNPHAILKVPSIQEQSALAQAKFIYENNAFPQGINVGLMAVIDQQHITLRTLERGSGETAACGSNACAAACAGIINGWVKSSVEVEFSRGSLFIDWQGDGTLVQMTGPAKHVFTGMISVGINCLSSNKD